MVALDARGRRLPTATFEVPSGFVDEHPCQRFIAATLELSDQWSCRLFALDPATGVHREQAARFALQIAQTVAPALYNTYLVRSIRSRARTLERAGLGSGDVDHYVPHQTSKDIIHEVCRRLGIPVERAFLNLHRHANIGAAGWVVALAEARAERLKAGQRVLIASVGGGMSWGAALWEWR